MSKVYVFLGEGFEEIEALTPVDLLRRAGAQVVTVSVGAGLDVTGAHGVSVKADALIGDVELDGADLLVCPGGMPGAANLAACAPLCQALKAQAAAGRLVAAICAAPAVTLAPLGVLAGKDATCYPGFEPALAQAGARHRGERVVADGNIITANGPASAMPWACALVEALAGSATARRVADGLLV